MCRRGPRVWKVKVGGGALGPVLVDALALSQSLQFCQELIAV